MRPGPRHYAALEVTALLVQTADGLDPAHDPFAFEDDPGPHSRLVSAFAWHPLFRRTMGLPPLGLFLIGWLSAAIFHMHSRIPQLWGDESFTWELATNSWDHLMQRLAGDLHPPLYFAFAKVLADLGLTDPLQLRTAIYIPVALGLGLMPLWIQAWPPIWRRFAAMGALVLVLFPFDLYLVQLRYYGLLTLLLVTALVALGNSLESGDRTGRWRLLARGCFVLATLTNYQSWLVWTVAEIIAWRLRERGFTDWIARETPYRPLFWMLGAVLLTWGLFAGQGLSPFDAFRNATNSPFTTGFASTLLEFGARLGVIALTTLASEMVPLWWLPVLALLIACWWTRTPHPQQSSLSATAHLCLGVAGSVTLIMCVLTVSAMPVGVEFLPARLAYVVPLWWIGLTEWILRRNVSLKAPLALFCVHWLMLGWGYLRCAEAIADPAPAASAPFLHATYLAPFPGVRTILRDAHPDPAHPPVVHAGAGLELGLKRYLPVPESRSLTGTFYLFVSTRDAVVEPITGFVKDEEWLFLREDPLWYALKQFALDRDVQPYKYRLIRFVPQQAADSISTDGS